MKPLILLLLLLCTWAAHASVPTTTYQFAPNRGQWPTPVRYAGQVPGGWLFLENTAFTYHLREAVSDEAPATTPVRGHAFRVHLLGATAGGVEGLLPQDAYHNYFLDNDPSHWAGQVPLFGLIRYQRVYAGVQLLWHTRQGQLEYDFELAAGVRPDVIRLRYEGLSGLSLHDGALQLRTSLGTITEQAPVAWQTDDAGRRQYLRCRYRLRGTEVGFELPDGYDASQPLTIDPTVVFATYSGSVGGMSANASALDAAGNVYYGGQAFGPGYPASVGAYQTTGTNGSMVLGKTSPDGRRLLYGTYLGTGGTNYPLDLVVNALGELHVLCVTTSTSFPTTPTAFDRSLASSQDLAITRFSASGGALLGSTYLGGSQMEAGSLSSVAATIALDAAGNVLVGSSTNSADFPTVNSIKLSKPFSDGVDGFVTKLTPTLSGLLWSTFLGGSGEDGVNDIRPAPNGQVYVCGQTTSLNFPVSAGVVGGSFQGVRDGFVTSFSADGRRIVASTFLGTPSNDLARYLVFDEAGRVFVAGATQGLYPTTAGVLASATSTSLGNLFVHCLNSTLTQTQFSTRLATGTMMPAGFALGYCDRLYLASYASTSGTSALPLSADAAERNPRGLYLCTLSAGAQSLVYGTYYGTTIGQHQHPAAANQITAAGTMVYIECTTSRTYPVTPGVFAPSAGNSSNDGAIMKFDMTGLPLLQAAVAPVAPQCAPLLVPFVNNSSGARTFEWNFGDGSAPDTARSPRHLYQVPGVYRARLVAYLPTPCGLITDTAYTTVRVGTPLPPVPERRAYITCNGRGNLTVGADAATVFRWSTGSDERVLTPAAPGRYTLYRSHPDSCFAPLTFELLPAPPLLLPNVVTANGDNLNRAFVVPPQLENPPVKLFNRWGRLVYQAARYDNSWPTTPPPAGVYYYEIRPKACDTVIKGWVEVLN